MKGKELGLLLLTHCAEGNTSNVKIIVQTIKQLKHLKFKQLKY